MGSLAQNSSGVHRRRIRFNGVPEKVPEKVCESLVQSQVRFNRVSERRFRSGEGSGEGVGGFGAEPRAGLGSTSFQRFRKAVVESRARFNEVPEKVLEKVREGFWCGQVQRGFL